MLAATAVIANHRYNAELADAAREMRTLDLVLAAETARSFQSVELVLDNIAEQIGAGGDVTPAEIDDRGSTEAVHEILKARVADVPQLDAVTIVSASGRLINFSRSWPIPDVHLSDRDYFKALRDGHDKLFLSEPVLNRGSGTPTVYLARRLSARDGTFLGLALGAIQLASFDRLYGSLELGRGDIIALWRRDGVLLALLPGGGGRPALAARGHHAARCVLARRDGSLCPRERPRRRRTRDPRHRLAAGRRRGAGAGQHRPEPTRDPGGLAARGGGGNRRRGRGGVALRSRAGLGAAAPLRRLRGDRRGVARGGRRPSRPRPRRRRRGRRPRRPTAPSPTSSPT